MVTLDGYVRVSRVNGRDGDSFMSPDLQREQITAWADGHDARIGQWHEELDWSGGREDRPKWQAALGRVERGDTGGIIVATFDRFARSVAHGARAIDRVEKAGGRFIAIREGIDTGATNGSSATARYMQNTWLNIAELERNTKREGWQAAIGKAVEERGVHICRIAPTGYRKGHGKRLEPDPATAPHVRQVFLRRATGEGWESLARYLNEEAVTLSDGRRTVWRGNSVGRIVRNPVYRGEARGQYGTSNPEAHEPIVSPAEWQAAQLPPAIPARIMRSGALLSEIVRCASCGGSMRPSSKKRLGRIVYACSKSYATGRCPGPATIGAPSVEPFVVASFFAVVEDQAELVAGGRRDDATDEALAAVEEAEADLTAYVSDPEIAKLVGRDTWHRGLAARQEVLETTRAEYQRALATRPLADVPGTPANLRDAWDTLSVSEQRAILAGVIDKVFVRPVGGRTHVTAAERCRIVWRGEDVNLGQLPGRGRSVPLRDFGWLFDEPGGDR